MTCSGCQNQAAYAVRFVSIPGQGIVELCDQCGDVRPRATPDVWYGYGSGTHTEENICYPKTGTPIPFSSKREKLAAMQKAGVREAGDRIHGSNNFDKTSHRNNFKQAPKKKGP